MKLCEIVNTWIINVLFLLTGISLILFYIAGIILAFIAVAK